MERANTDCKKSRCAGRLGCSRRQSIPKRAAGGVHCHAHRAKLPASPRGCLMGASGSPVKLEMAALNLHGLRTWDTE